tara:strand:- start:16 stop:642 length:627 start_codon:yes stop_codon:yes gene_type:complete
MCVKCGINSCGCDGKTTSTVFSGDVKYDGTTLLCGDDLEIQPLDNLTGIIEKTFSALCANKTWISKVDLDFFNPISEVYNANVPEFSGTFNSPIGVGYEFLPTDAGIYQIDFYIDYKLIGFGAPGSTDVGSVFLIGEATTSLNLGQQRPISSLNLTANTTIGGSLHASIIYNHGTTTQRVQLCSQGVSSTRVGEVYVGQVQTIIKKIG